MERGLGMRSVGPGPSTQGALPHPPQGSGHCLEKAGSHGSGDLCISGLFPPAPFPGCVLLYKQDFTKKLGLCCITCTYCSQTCQRGVTEQLDGSTWDFCSEDCKSKYLLWYCKVRRQRVTKERKGGRQHRLLGHHQGMGQSLGRGLHLAPPPKGAVWLLPGQRVQHI